MEPSVSGDAIAWAIIGQYLQMGASIASEMPPLVVTITDVIGARGSGTGEDGPRPTSSTMTCPDLSLHRYQSTNSPSYSLACCSLRILRFCP